MDKEINQRLVQKRSNVINFRNAEEAVVQVNQTEVKYLTLGRKKPETNVSYMSESSYYLVIIYIPTRRNPYIYLGRWF